MRTIGLVGGHARDVIPASHRDLVACPPVAALSTVMPDGRPQTSVVWCDFDGTCVRVNTMRGFAKERNMRRDPRVTLLCYDPRRPIRYFGDAIPARFAATETPVLCRIRPTHVVALDATGEERAS